MTLRRIGGGYDGFEWFRDDVTGNTTRLWPKPCRCCGSRDRQVDATDSLCRGSGSCASTILEWAVTHEILPSSNVGMGFWESQPWLNVVEMWMSVIAYARAKGAKQEGAALYSTPEWAVAMDVVVHGAT